MKNLKDWGITPNTKKLDLTNKQFGELIALYPAPSRNDKYTRWVCKCSCGKEIEVRTDYLTSNHTTSCGHIKEQYITKKDLIGQRFGRLTVIENLYSQGKKKCLCDCGNIIDVVTTNLTNGNTKSCGCYQKEQASKASLNILLGQRFGKLTVIERAPNNRYNHVCWKCQCDCGGITIVDVNNLRNGTTNSCGCIKSKGEMIVQQLLQECNINYKSQYSLDNIFLESGRRPIFDFAIFDNNNNLQCLLEYDGKQHFEYSGYGWNTEENFKQTINRDKQKDKLCKENNIPLIRIPYWELDNINKEWLLNKIQETIQNDE